MHAEELKSHGINKAYEQSVCCELIIKATDLDVKRKFISVLSRTKFSKK